MATPDRYDPRYGQRYDQALIPFHAGGVLARNWWLLALRGALAVLFGVVAFAVPGLTVTTLVLVFGAYMLVDGVFALAAGLRAAARHERWGSLVLEGVLDLAAGAIAFAYPILTVFAFVTFAAAWAVLTGVSLLVAGFRLRGDHGKGWMLLAAVLSIAWGVALFMAPAAGVLVLTWWLGGYAIVFGIVMLALAFRLRTRRAA